MGRKRQENIFEMAANAPWYFGVILAAVAYVGLKWVWHKAEKLIGIKFKLQEAFRHSLGCQLCDKGYSQEVVRRILGHTDFKMTKRYAQHSKAVLTDALEDRSANVIDIKQGRLTT